MCFQVVLHQIGPQKHQFLNYLFICLQGRGGEGREGWLDPYRTLGQFSHESLFSTPDSSQTQLFLNFQELIYAVSKDPL